MKKNKIKIASYYKLMKAIILFSFFYYIAKQNKRKNRKLKHDWKVKNNHHAKSAYRHYLVQSKNQCQVTKDHLYKNKINK